MKLYCDCKGSAPNPRRVRIFAAEKKIDLVLVRVDLAAGENRTPEFLAKNSSGQTPVMELDDGSCLSESVAICRYLEGLHPDPNLFGGDLREQVDIEIWNRRMEFELLEPATRAVLNTNPIFRNRLHQFVAYGEAQQASLEDRHGRMNRELEGGEFVAEGRFTIADITALVAIDVAIRMLNLKISRDHENLIRWKFRAGRAPRRENGSMETHLEWACSSCDGDGAIFQCRNWPATASRHSFCSRCLEFALLHSITKNRD
ncbi:Glutathione S-transferase GST-6.0 [Methylocystis sp. MJC1]|jgi:glutathione S-transferase|nr:Glutathione S-transferase GST-6.0 [Methylocystis sp. MJC1]